MLENQSLFLNVSVLRFPAGIYFPACCSLEKSQLLMLLDNFLEAQLYLRGGVSAPPLALLGNIFNSGRFVCSPFVSELHGLVDALRASRRLLKNRVWSYRLNEGLPNRVAE